MYLIMDTFLIENVLVPTDFSVTAQNAINTAIAICKRHLARLTLLHVVEANYIVSTPSATVNGPLLPDVMNKAMENMNEIALNITRDHNLTVDCVVESGNPTREICQCAERMHTNLIVIGTEGATGARQFLFGTRAYQVVKRARCAVMTVPAGSRWLHFKRVLFPVRAVPNARDKYLAARPIIKKNDSALLIAGIVKKTDLQGWRDVQVLVESIESDVTGDKVICGSEIHPCEDLAREVLVISDLEEPDLIVITATPTTFFHDFFHGPYTQNIINHARFPVLSTKPPAVNDGDPHFGLTHGITPATQKIPTNQ
jgi:nucleotide-binding universal stress UspA family protein